MTQTVTVADDILAIFDLKTIDVVVPEWDRTIRVRMLTGKQMVDFSKWHARLSDGSEAIMKAGFLTYAIVDNEGKQVFKLSQVDELSNKSASAIERLWNAAGSLNKMFSSDVDKIERD